MLNMAKFSLEIELFHAKRRLFQGRLRSHPNIVVDHWMSS